MEYRQLIRETMRRENVTGSALSWRLGKSKNYIGDMLSSGRDISTSTTLEIFAALGYEVCIHKADSWQAME